VKLKGGGCRRAGSRKEITSKVRVRPVQARLDALLTDAETLRGLGRAQTFDLS
jgi:hypothetical protein